MQTSSLLLSFLLGLLVTIHAEEEAVAQSDHCERGTASWYGRECSRTACGERYDPASFTAAHRTLPFGTMVRVTNLSNNLSTTVRINNRGPFKKGRIIDISQAAAQQLKMVRAGTASVEVVRLAGP